MIDDLTPTQHEAASGCAYLAAWPGAVIFAVGSALLALMVVTRAAGPYGVAALLALAVMLVGVALFGAAAFAWVFHRLRHHRRPWLRSATALAMFGVAFGLLGLVAAEFVGWLELPPDTWWPVVVGVTLLAFAAVLAVERHERPPAWLFAVVWVALLATAGYRTSTDLEARVVWLGPTSSGTSTVFAFVATRSAGYEVRFGAPSCGEGRVIATGRYEWREDDPDSAYGASAWIDLPPDVLPLENGDVVRVCLRDGLAAGTASGESVGPGMGFWPKD